MSTVQRATYIEGSAVYAAIPGPLGRLSVTMGVLIDAAPQTLTLEFPGLLGDALGQLLQVNVFSGGGTDPYGGWLWKVWSDADTSAVVMGGAAALLSILGPAGGYLIECQTDSAAADLGYALEGIPNPTIPPASIDGAFNVENLVLSGLNVTAWQDQLGNLPDLVASTPGTWDASGGNNGTGAVQFGPALYQTANFGLAQPYGLVLIKEIATHGTSVDGLSLVIDLEDDAFENSAYCGGGGTMGDGTPPPVGWYAVGLWADGDSSELYVDGSQTATGGGGSPGNSSPLGLTMGGRFDGSNQGIWSASDLIVTSGGAGVAGMLDAMTWAMTLRGL